jgi:hypothetical protein
MNVKCYSDNGVLCLHVYKFYKGYLLGDILFSGYMV